MFPTRTKPSSQMFLTLVSYFAPVAINQPLYTDTSGACRITVEPELIDIEKGKYHQ